jgi:hypothetical protein
VRGDILRDVSQHIIRFDQALVELAQENASLRSRLANYEVDDAPPSTFPITSELATQQQYMSSAVRGATAPGWGNFRLGALSTAQGGSGGNSPGMSRSGASTPLPTSPRAAGPSHVAYENDSAHPSGRSAVAAMGSVFSRQAAAAPHQSHSDRHQSHQQQHHDAHDTAHHKPSQSTTASRSGRGHHGIHDDFAASHTIGSRLESPDRTQIVDRSGLVGSAAHSGYPSMPRGAGQQLRDDPLIGVFGEYQASP